MPVNDETKSAVSKSSRAVSRRELGHNFLSLIALGIFPGLSAAHPICGLLNAPVLDSLNDVASSEKYNLAFLASSQFAALEKLSEAMIPGSNKAKSAEFIDLLLSVDSAASQRKFSDALAAFDTAAQQTFHKDLISLNADELNELLRAAADKQPDDNRYFDDIKGWVVGAYYSSEIGMKELGWTPDRVFSSYPACAHAESHS